MANKLVHTIGRIAGNFLRLAGVNATTYKTVDQTIADYVWWDKFRRGYLAGYEHAGSMAQGMYEIIAGWVIGRGITVKLDEVEDKRFIAKVQYTNDALRRLFLAKLSEIVTIYEDYLALGDQYVVVNNDGTWSIVPPNQIEVEYDPLDYRKAVAIKIVTKSDSVNIEDRYTDSDRVISIIQGTDKSSKRFRNPFGVIPIVHFANDISANEQRGRPFLQVLLPAMSNIDVLANKSYEGSRIAGNPIPVIEGLDDPQATLDLNKTQDDDTYTDKDGNTEDRVTIRWDNETALLVGAGGSFGFKAPPVGFSTDIIKTIQLFFWFIKNRSHVPEQMWGGDSTDLEKKDETPFVRFIESQRSKFAGQPFDKKIGLLAKDGLQQLIWLWLKARSFTDPRIYVGATVLQWADLTEGDETLKFEKIKWLHSRGGLQLKTALELLDLVENVNDEFEAAQEEFDAKQPMQAFDDFGGVGNNVSNPPMADNNKPDSRAGNGADAPRGPAFGGGGRNGNN